jgi:hypothetical protein
MEPKPSPKLPTAKHALSPTWRNNNMPLLLEVGHESERFSLTTRSEIFNSQGIIEFDEIAEEEAAGEHSRSLYQRVSQVR